MRAGPWYTTRRTEFDPMSMIAVRGFAAPLALAVALAVVPVAAFACGRRNRRVATLNGDA